MNKSKAKGTAAETDIVRALVDAGWTHAERRTLSGVNDRGDINLNPYPVMIEAKNCSTITISGWLKEVAVEQANAKAEVGACWFKLRGKGRAEDWAVVMTGQQFMGLLKAAGYHPDGRRDVP